MSESIVQTSATLRRVDVSPSVSNKYFSVVKIIDINLKS